METHGIIARAKIEGEGEGGEEGWNVERNTLRKRCTRMSKRRHPTHPPTPCISSTARLFRNSRGALRIYPKPSLPLPPLFLPLSAPSYFRNDVRRGSIVGDVCIPRPLAFRPRKEFECKCFGRLGLHVFLE